MKTIHHPRLSRSAAARSAAAVGCAVLALACTWTAATPAAGRVAIEASPQANTQQSVPSEKAGTSLESAAAKAGDTARTVAMSLIGLALAIASIVLAFRRDFKEAAGVFAVGIVAVLLATPAGLSLLQDTVTSLFGS
ncbi:MAG TPA: hypothetical protein VFC30_04865 [Solirubrobacteraceae bacterium]|nr:hypothetical protein [Solirubrobacteraceae bacterium]